MSTAVAISTTGDEHRMGFLETSIEHWDAALNPGDSLFVTVDGDDEVAERVRMVAFPWTGSVYQVGLAYSTAREYSNRKMGVAANKNTGLELMMDNTKAEHLFLCDDDTYPLSSSPLRAHKDNSTTLPHSMVCWGKHRLEPHEPGAKYASWTWPRGVLLYQRRAVVEQVGGMLETFGSGGHEHAEYSRRIHQHGLTPSPYCTPLAYALNSRLGIGYRASHSWHCEDMRRPDETSVELGHRRKKISTMKGEKHWDKANQIMAYMDGRTPYVPFRAHQNRRGSATLIPTSTGLGAGGDL